jgi:imidazolonepropionase-like amidohydrolase
MRRIIYNLMFLLSIVNITAQQTPASKQTEPISIEGATAHLGNGEIIENSLIMFKQGKIIFVGSSNTKIGRIGRVINASGKHIYPGFIAANSTLGLVEVDAVKASSDVRETGIMNPHIRSIIAYNAESKVVESMRPNGVLMAQITPRGGTISGTSSVVQLDAWNWEDASIKNDDAIHIDWPSSFTSGRWWLGEDPALKPDKNYLKKTQEITSFFKDAKQYHSKDNLIKNLPFSSTKGLFVGSQKLFIHANGQREITDAITMAKDLEIENLVLVNGHEAEKVSALLVKHNIPVILERPHRNPESEDHAYDYTYTIAKTLTDLGVLVGIGMEGQMERMNTRNLPFYAGTFAAHGLNREDAVKLITSNPAKILGIDDAVGTLEVGKDATLFISEGDALDMRGNILTEAFIQGRNISLESHQTKLWKRYSDKYKSE